MERKHVNLKSFILFLLLLLITKVRLEDHKEKRNLCAYLYCNENDVCVHRKFRCRDPPCPGMLYCAKSRTESLKGPSSCDTVRCTNGYVCMLKVRRCRWDETKCGQQIARCVSQKEYHEGPASCAGFKCPQGSHCILRESFCVKPPCKLLRSCGKNKEVHLWFGKCRILGCPSEFECFLRRPENTCLKPPCKHTPDCVTTTENEITNAHCRGWICPRMQKCSAKITGNCKLSDCTVQRTCHDAQSNYSSFFSRRSLDNEKNHLSSKIEPKNIPPSRDSNTKKEEINSFLSEQNLTNIIERLLVSNKILETALLNNLKQSNRSPFFDYILKYSLHTREQDLFSLLLKNKNMYEQPYFVFPVGNMKVAGSSTPNDQNSRYHGDFQNRNVPEPQRKLSFIEENLSPLRTKLHEDSEKISRRKETYNNENPNIKLMDEAQYFDEIPTDALEQLMKSLQFPLIEDVLNKLGNISTYNYSDQLSHVNSPASTLKQSIDENNDEMDLNLFLKLNKETLLPYIQSLMDVMNKENISPINVEPNLEATSMKQSFLKDNNLRSMTEVSDKLIPPEMSEKEIVIDEKSYNLNFSYESQFLKNENLDDSVQNEIKRVSTEKNKRKQQNSSRTTGLIYADEEPTILSHYSPPSYGISNAADIDDEDYKLETNETDYIDDDHRESVADYMKRN